MKLIDDAEKTHANDTLFKNNVQETITLDTFSYHRDFESEIENCARQVESPKTRDNQNFVEYHDNKATKEFELTEKELFNDSTVEILNDNSKDSETGNILDSVESVPGESNKCEIKGVNESTLSKDIDKNNTESDTNSTNNQELPLDTRLNDNSSHSVDENIVSESNSDSRHSISTKSSSSSLSQKSIDDFKLKRSYSSDSCNSDVIVIDRSRYTNKDEEEDIITAKKSASSDGLDVEKKSLDYENWPPDVVIVDDVNDPLPIDEVETDKNKAKEKLELTESNDSNTIDNNTQKDDPFQR